MNPMTGPVSLEVAGRQVTITHPDKVVFPGPAGQGGGAGPYTKLDLVRYYLAVADGALRGVAGRPMILKRFVKGISARSGVPEASTHETAGLGRRRRTALRVGHLGRGSRYP